MPCYQATETTFPPTVTSLVNRRRIETKGNGICETVLLHLKLKA